MESPGTVCKQESRNAVIDWLVCHCRATFDISSEYNFDADDADDARYIDTEVSEASGAGIQRDSETALDSHQQSLTECRTSHNIQPSQSYAPV